MGLSRTGGGQSETAAEASVTAPVGRPSPRAAWAAVAAFVFALGWLFGDFRTRTGWDDTYYLLQVSSLAEDGDLDLRNDAMWSRLAPRDLQTFLTSTLPSGALKNTFSIGTAALWLPAYAAGMPWRDGAGTPAATRWSRVQLEALHLLSLAFLAAVGGFLYRLLATAGGARGDRADRQTALLGTLALLLGTPLAVYGPAVYTMAHLPSAFTTSLFVASVLWLEKDARPYRALLAGVALGLVFLVRWQDAVFGLLLWVPLAPLLRGRRELARLAGESRNPADLPGERRDLARLAKLLMATTGGGLAMALLQFHVWHLELGSWLTMPQGGDYMRWSQPRLREFLLSGHSGLLPWSPVFAVAVAGLLLPWRCRLSARWRIVALLVLAVEIYVNSAVRDWWGGDSFGARRMSSCVPLLAIGLANLAAAAVASRRRRQLAALLGALALWGCFTTNLYWQQVKDLSLVVRGVPSTAAREVTPENDAVTDPTTARRQALRPAVTWLRNDFAGLPGIRRSLGILLTAALMGAAVAGTCFLLAAGRAALLLQAALLVLLGTVLSLHLRLAGAPRPDAAERLLWRRTADGVNEPRSPSGRIAAAAEAEAALLDARAASPADAYRYLAMLASFAGGEPPRALRALRGLAGRGYPAAVALWQEVQALEPGSAPLRMVPGSFFEPHPGAPSRAIALPAVGGERGAWEIAFDLRLGALEPGAAYDVATLQDANRTELARIALQGPRAVQLATPRQTVEAALPGGTGRTYRFHLHYDPYDPRGGAVSLTLSSHDAGSARLSSPSAAGGGPPSRLLLGRDRQGHSSFPLWSSTFSELRVTAAVR